MSDGDNRCSAESEATLEPPSLERQAPGLRVGRSCLPHLALAFGSQPSTGVLHLSKALRSPETLETHQSQRPTFRLRSGGEGKAVERKMETESGTVSTTIRASGPGMAGRRSNLDPIPEGLEGRGSKPQSSVWLGRNVATQTSNQTQTDSLSPSPNPVSPVPLNNPASAPRYGTVIPNRIFVGGIDFKAEKLNYKDKKLNIGPAIRKQQVGIPRSSIMPAAGTMYLTTSTGYPYTYHNGVAYFHTPEVTSVPPPWPSRSISSSPVMVAQPVYQQPAYHYQAPAQCLPGQWQWGVPQPYSDHGVQATYHQVYAPSAIAMPAPVMQPEPIKVNLF
ncbi:Protein boule-like protein [Tupaia chinensis]|uniref:Protein boule-like protein n=1 Tax=Tupaia chinensis TaxID=246437 RepID=L9KNJ4_TUPCH|nr:Protein boule-like protein [Tupaia chinensis]